MSDETRSQETTRAHSRTKTLEGGLAPRVVVAVFAATRVLGHLLVGEDARLYLCHARFIRQLSLFAALGFAAACSSAESDNERVRQSRGATAAPSDTDDFGAALPQDARFASRVVSLNPAATEAIFAIGADSTLVGRSKWDEFPTNASRIPALGDGIRPNIEAVLAVRPTLVILYATPENRSASEALQRAGVPTIALRVDRIEQFHHLLRVLGQALGSVPQATTVSDSVRTTLSRVQRLTSLLPLSARQSAVWPVWESPVIVIGAGSYLDELLVIAGAQNVFHDMAAPSSPVSIEEIAKRNPDVVVTSPTRAATLTSLKPWNAISAVREKRFVLADPTITGRPSVVLGMAAVHLARMLHPQLADSLK